MKYAVEMTPTAESELLSAFQYIHERAPLNAQRWLRGIYKAIGSLETFPARCGIAQEAQYLGESIRNHLYKSHRIIFQVDEAAKIVRILYVRHAARRAIGDTTEADDN